VVRGREGEGPASSVVVRAIVAGIGDANAGVVIAAIAAAGAVTAASGKWVTGGAGGEADWTCVEGTGGASLGRPCGIGIDTPGPLQRRDDAVDTAVFAWLVLPPTGGDVVLGVTQR
jgi:hypothetical protein